MNALSNNPSDNSMVDDPPDRIGEKIILVRNGDTKTYRGDYRIYFDGFDWISKVDRRVPVKEYDTAIAYKDRSVIARGTVTDVRRASTDTTFYVSPPPVA